MKHYYVKLEKTDKYTIAVGSNFINIISTLFEICKNEIPVFNNIDDTIITIGYLKELYNQQEVNKQNKIDNEHYH